MAAFAQVEMNNDYSAFESKLTDLDSSIPGISLIIPTFNRAEKIGKMLAALRHQDIPLNSIEVVVADDGSSDGTRELVCEAASIFDIKHVWQPDRGHRLAAVCNLGIRAARFPNIIMLQSDMLPGKGLVRAYSRWLSLDLNALFIGRRIFVDTDELTRKEIASTPDFEVSLRRITTKNEMWTNVPAHQSEDWREELYRRTNRLKSERWPFRAVVGSNLAFNKKLINIIGLFDEDFQSWGGEDGEFGYRAFNAGAYFIPVSDAIGYHQEPPGGVNETERITGFETSRRIREKKCALPPFRKLGQGQETCDNSSQRMAEIVTIQRGDPDSMSLLNIATEHSLSPYIIVAYDQLNAQVILDVCSVLTSGDGAPIVEIKGSPHLVAFSKRSWAQMGKLKQPVFGLEQLAEQLGAKPFDFVTLASSKGGSGNENHGC